MTASAKVLVVDDDAVVGRSFERVLTEKGYAVSTALSGEEALDKFSDRDYDVVFADIKMPGMDGLEVTRRIKERCPWTPVVIVTGHGNAAHEAEAKVLGVNGFVHKPLSPEMIEGITLKALDERGHRPEAGEAAEAVAEAETPEAEAPEELRGAKKALRFTRNVALFIAAPFVGLVYAIALPFVGLGMIAVMGYRALTHRPETTEAAETAKAAEAEHAEAEAAEELRGGKKALRFARSVGLFLIAPFIGLVYAIALPFVGLGMIAVMAYRAATHRPETA